MTKNESLINKIQGLLAKAEASEYEGESRVYREKAEALMAEYAVTAGDLTVNERGAIDHEIVLLDGTYVGNRLELFDVVAETSNVFLYRKMDQPVRTMTLADGTPYSYKSGNRKAVGAGLIGHEHDREIAKLLFNSLEAQMLANMPPGDRNFKVNYISAFVSEVRVRLTTTKRRAQREYGPGLVPVDDLKRMRRWATDELGMSFSSSRSSRRANAGAKAAGGAAGRRADVGQPRMGRRAELTR